MLGWLKRRVGKSAPAINSRTGARRSLPPIELVSDACPYCGIIQEPPPTRRKKCADCGGTIYTYTDRESRKKHLLTKRDYERQQRERRDTRWRELSREVQRASQAGDWQALAAAQQSQAAILFAEGRPHHEVSVAAAKATLMGMAALGISHVRIGTVRDGRVCGYCAELDGTKISVKQALKNPPIPSKICTDGADQNPHGGRCRCRYGPVFPELE